MKQIFNFLLIGLACVSAPLSHASENEDKELTAAILAIDKQFWTAYNTCDVERSKQFFTEDLEFYHDKGGSSTGLEPFIEKMKQNLCGGTGFRLRREAVPGTELVFPLRNGNEIYGAIMSGEHVFYVTESGKPEYLDGKANFTHLWLKKDGTFKMARVLSYHHRPAIEKNEKKENKLSQAQLDLLTGSYTSPQFGKIKLTREGDHLLLESTKSKSILYPKTENLFFSKERDLTFEFQPAKGKPAKMIVRERGQVVDEVTREQ